MRMSALADQLKSGAISLAEWQSGMKDAVLSELTAAMELAKGGRDFVTQADWGYVGSQAKKQYHYIDGFAAEIAANPEVWLTGDRLNSRVALYNQVGWGVLEEDLNREQKKAGYTEERRVLGAVKTEHCHGVDARPANKKHKAREARPGCVEMADLGWTQIGALPLIGDAACWSNCRCKFEYRKPDPARPGEWIIK